MDIDPKLTAVLRGYPEIRVAFLFGSRASGAAGPESDIDVGVLADTPIDPERKLSLIEALGLELGVPADVVDLHGAPEPVLGEVLRGRRIIGDDATHAKLVTAHVINAADFLPLRQRILAERRAAWIG